MEKKSISPFSKLFNSKYEFEELRSGQYLSLLVIIGFYGIICLLLFLVYVSRESTIFLKTILGIISFFGIGWVQFCISNGMHEAIHRNFFNKKYDLFACILTAYPIGLTMGYRAVHLRHHLYIGTSQDPDYAEYCSFPKNKVKFIGRFLYYLSGYPAIRQFLFLRGSNINDAKHLDLILFLVVQTLIFLAISWAFQNFLYYFLFYALPLATVAKLFSSTRLLCEHASPEGWVIRTISGPRYKTWVLGAFDFNYHAEHHLIPGIPYPHLKELHRRNINAISNDPIYRPFGDKLVFYEGGYMRLILKFYKELSWI